MGDKNDERKRKQYKKPRGFFTKLFLLFTLFVLLLILGLVSWYSYSVYIEKDPVVQSKGMLGFAEEKLTWALTSGESAYLWAASLVSSNEEVIENASEKIADVAESMNETPPQTATVPVVESPEAAMADKADQFIKSGREKFGRASRTNYRRDIMLDARKDFENARDIVTKLLSQDPDNRRYNNMIQEIGQFLFDISKQTPMK